MAGAIAYSAEAPPQSRSAAFQGGVSGGNGTHIATQQQGGVPDMFSSGSLLALPNRLPTQNGRSEKDFALRNYQANYERKLMQSTAQPGSAYMNV